MSLSLPSRPDLPLYKTIQRDKAFDPIPVSLSDFAWLISLLACE